MSAFWKTLRGTVMAVAAILNLSSTDVCFNEEGIGCFSNKAPFNNARGLLPDPPDKIQVKFYLYTRGNRMKPQEVTFGSIGSSYFSVIRASKFLIHGYRDDCFQTWVNDTKNALLDKGDFNVFCVDWEKGADQMDYNQAVANTRVVGALTAKFITALKQGPYAGYSHVHIIGHSLGAHIAGYTGKTEKTLDRITGLDPAGYGFETGPAEVRLDKKDAKYVDVIHTDGEPLKSLGLGLSKAIGHADFYPNGGEDQPGCQKMGPHLFKLITGKFKGFIKGVGCDHSRARDYFIESIQSSCRFKAYPCSSEEDFTSGKCKSCNGRCTRMGYKADLNPVTGTFYLTTNTESPFCQS